MIDRTPNGGFVCGRLIVERDVRQAHAAPVLDGGTVTLHTDTDERVRFGAVVIMPRPAGRAIAVGWRDAKAPLVATWRWLPRRWRTMR